MSASLFRIFVWKSGRILKRRKECFLKEHENRLDGRYVEAIIGQVRMDWVGWSWREVRLSVRKVAAADSKVIHLGTWLKGKLNMQTVKWKDAWFTVYKECWKWAPSVYLFESPPWYAGSVLKTVTWEDAWSTVQRMLETASFRLSVRLTVIICRLSFSFILPSLPFFHILPFLISLYCMYCKTALYITLVCFSSPWKLVEVWGNVLNGYLLVGIGNIQTAWSLIHHTYHSQYPRPSAVNLRLRCLERIRRVWLLLCTSPRHG